VKYDLVIIRYSEIALKQKETRKRFENVLVSNIKNALNHHNITSKIKKEWGRIYIYTDKINDCIPILQTVFGINSVSPAITTKSLKEQIAEVALELANHYLTKNQSFAVKTTRTGNHSFTSQEMSAYIGGEVQKKINSPVNLSHPDFQIFIEIRKETAYVFTQIYRGVGGLPMGTQGLVAALVHNANDILAAWYLLKRGCNVLFIISDHEKQLLLDRFQKKWNIQKETVCITDEKNYDQINNVLEEKKCLALVTGHHLYPTHKEKIKGLTQLNEKVNVPILSPLIAMDSQTITNKYREIGVVK